MCAGGHSELEELTTLQQRLQFDDPINIQFTSVRIDFCSIHMQCYLHNNSSFQAFKFSPDFGSLVYMPSCLRGRSQLLGGAGLKNSKL
jgi:hypothetical protein